MIYTVTLNPAVDYYLTVADQPFLVSEVNRAQTTRYRVGGKGINVSLLLAKLGVPSTAIALLAGFTGDFIADDLKSEELIKLRAITAGGNNRINVKIYHGDRTLSINGKGLWATTVSKEELIRSLAEVKENDWVLYCGSSIENIDDDFLIELCQLVKLNKAKLVLDMETLTLELLKSCAPYLIKPNFYEFKKLVKQEDLSEEKLDNYLEEVLACGVESILLSLGEKGALLVSKTGRYRMCQQEIVAPNKVGCGDAMLAAYVGCLARGQSIEEALSWAGAAGMAVVGSREEVDYPAIEENLQRVTVEKIN